MIFNAFSALFAGATTASSLKKKLSLSFSRTGSHKNPDLRGFFNVFKRLGLRRGDQACLGIPPTAPRVHALNQRSTPASQTSG